jgi:hypothetical protein
VEHLELGGVELHRLLGAAEHVKILVEQEGPAILTGP